MDVFQVLHRASGCHNKRVIHNKLGMPLLVPCGTCSYCRNSRSTQLALLCDKEASASRYCAMVNLDYDNDHLPIMRFGLPTTHIGRADEVFSEPVEISLTSMRDNRPARSTRVGKIVSMATLPTGKTFFEYTDKYYYISQPKDKYGHLLEKSQILWDGCRAVGYLDYYDIQTFLKRLRFKIAYHFNGAQIRYFYVGEYGPRTFRPHFHILVYFDNPSLLTSLQRFCSECWSYGNCVYALTSQASSYVAGYVTADTDIPKYLCNRVYDISPKKRHSNFFGKGNSAFNLLPILSRPDKDTWRTPLIKKGVQYIPLSRYDVSSVLPKFPFSTFHSDESITQILFTCVRLLKRSEDLLNTSKFSRKLFSRAIYDAYALGVYPSSDLIQPISQVAWFLSLHPSSDAEDRHIQRQRISTLFDYARNYLKRYKPFITKLSENLGFIGDSMSLYSQCYTYLHSRFDLVNLKSFYEQNELISKDFPDALNSQYIDTFEPRTTSLNMVFQSEDFNNSLRKSKHRDINSMYIYQLS